MDISHLGLNFVVGLGGPVLLPEEQRLLKLLRPAGIILFAKNIAADSEAPGDSWIPAMRQLIADAQSAINRQDLLVAIDHEGGRVHRLRSPVTHFPAARAWPESSYEIARAMARELRSLGFNLSFLPVLDVHCEPLNQVIGARSFGAEPETVANAAIACAEGLHSQGVLSCGKHFPGHGATVADSHLELPVLDVPEDVLRARELLPFRRFLAIKPPLMMTAHVRYPALDPVNPATMSPRILKSLLREELGFSGTIISDDLEMAALRHFDPGERARRVLAGGVDLLLQGYSSSSLLPLEIAAQMAAGLAQAEASLSGDIARAQQHVDRLFQTLGRLQQRSELASYPLELIGCGEHRGLCERVNKTA